ncbi:peptidylprolyl isomerase [Tamaricihabitans halophyticus]|uniref:Peptidyl-prolyl cis-trans isomerase n=1 Tax=Tamaricihabitans halophyticus TaxID=1262583 RepID=A0A4R2QB85_9PSEU|nr:peptidylprolyl isomerase [Tamaricihabitans halophyticus]
MASVALVGCTPDEQDSPEQARSTATAGSEQQAEQGGTESAQPCTAEDIEVSGEAGQEPDITLPEDCAPPTELISEELTPGSGPGVQEGDNVTVNYKLVAWSDQQEKDNSWDRGEPFTVEGVGSGQVIPGWDQGLIGIRQGERKLLAIPPELGYGPQGQGEIGPDETLVFVVDVVRVG